SKKRFGADDHRSLIKTVKISAMSEVFSGRQHPRYQGRKLGAMKTADRAAGADAQLGIQVQERLAITNDLFFQAQRQDPLIAIAAAAIEDETKGPLRRRTCLVGNRQL